MGQMVCCSSVDAALAKDDKETPEATLWSLRDGLPLTRAPSSCATRVPGVS